MDNFHYLMEDSEEIIRLDLKTDETVLHNQAAWAGIKPGMRVLDIGCGAGKTTYYLNKMVQPGGSTVGIDASEDRINYAEQFYKNESTDFYCKNIFSKIEDLGKFDFIWIRFFLEYYHSKSFEIVEKATELINTHGIVCLIDLDNNCMNSYGLPDRLSTTISNIIKCLEKYYDFDPNAGRKLYSYLYDLGYKEINVKVDAHHNIYGELSQKDLFNWEKKLQAAVTKSNYDFKEYNYDCREFIEEFKSYIINPRRFIYTPVILCRGKII